jgi:hypothetical protein
MLRYPDAGGAQPRVVALTDPLTESALRRDFRYIA